MIATFECLYGVMCLSGASTWKKGGLCPEPVIWKGCS